jgi:hypothetical protein
MNDRTTFPVWEYDKFLSSLGSDHEIQQLVADKGFKPPPLKTIAGWRLRNSIPGRWLPLLIDEGRQRGLHVNVINRDQTLGRRTAAPRPKIKPEWADL